MKIVDGKDFIPQVKSLIIEYTERLGRDLTFQHIEEELQNPAAKYTAPEGEILVVLDGNEVLGMVAYHRHNEIRCEMKRLYVKPKARGLHLGETLIKAIISHAQKAGYKEMVLDTITPLKAAINLYETQGFIQCEPYYDNPMNDVIYMMKKL